MEVAQEQEEEETSLIGAVDIGGTKIAVGAIDDEGKVLARLECATEPDRGYAEALQRIAQMLRATARTANSQISGIGIGSTGPVYPLTGEFGEVNFFPHWKGEIPSKIRASLPSQSRYRERWRRRRSG